MTGKKVWTDQQQATLARLAAAGKTGSEIAAEMGFTRSAVMGRAHRTGVKLPLTMRKLGAQSARSAGLWSDQAKRVHSLRMRLIWQEPGFRERVSAAMREGWAARKARA